MQQCPSATSNSRNAAAAASSKRRLLCRDARNDNKNNFEYALLFDCDGVILETEEFHRRAYNTAFREFNLTINDEPVSWSVEYYDVLQNTVGGGKPKMRWHFQNTAKTWPKYYDKKNNEQQPAPTTPDEQSRLIDQLQDCKTKHFQSMILRDAQARPGVLELMDEALHDPRIAVGVCSAATKAAAVTTLQATLGSERLEQLDVLLLGDDVAEKKPHPMIYDTARETLNMDASKCVVIEDSLVGLRAANAAKMKCIITYTASTAAADFYEEGAAAKLSDLSGVTLEHIFGPLRNDGDEAEMLVGLKDEQ
ncbi:hypothetical protein MPSEU_001081900 [Mayamaea pseudoterrestris]|nr:hypothetical protein MPSEU_001081900 [Mayamaea pseudoterrestris]